jgi:hypothetical protein
MGQKCWIGWDTTIARRGLPAGFGFEGSFPSIDFVFIAGYVLLVSSGSGKAVY